MYHVRTINTYLIRTLILCGYNRLKYVRHKVAFELMLRHASIQCSACLTAVNAPVPPVHT